MILTIDIGNTTISIGGLEKGSEGDYTVNLSAKMDTIHSRNQKDYLDEMKDFMEREGVSSSSFDGAVISSVVPCLTRTMQDCACILTGKSPVLITIESDTGLIVNVPEPNQVGLDRLVGAAWAGQRFPLPVITVDMGTATTFNVVDQGRVFLGGGIAPGLNTGLRALSERTAQLPYISLSTPNHVIGRTTTECMLSGAVMGAAAMVDGITARIEAQLGKPVTLVITGGMAGYVEPLCSHSHIYEPDLLSKGLDFLYERNIGSSY